MRPCLIVSALCGWMLVRSNRRKNRAAVAETQRPAASRAKDTEGVIEECIAEVCYTMGQVTRIYDRTLIAVFRRTARYCAKWCSSRTTCSTARASGNTR